MVSEPALSEMSLHNEIPSGSQAQLEKAQSDGVQLRREVLRWKMLARQHERRLKEIESSVTWRILGIVRILPELRYRWKLLLVVAVLTLVSLPFWPLLAILLCFTTGRDLIVRMLWKIQPLNGLMAFVRQKFLDRTGSRSEVSEITPIVYKRPTGVDSPAPGMTKERLYWLLLQQLCPKRRILLQDSGLTRSPLIRDDETPDLLSLSSAEISVLRITTWSRHATESGSVRS